MILSQGCKLNFSKPTWCIKLDVLCALYMPGVGPHCADIRTENIYHVSVINST